MLTLARALLPIVVLTTESVGRAILNVVRYGNAGPLLEVKYIAAIVAANS